MIEAPPRPAWSLDAACRGCDPELFYPEVGDGAAVAAAAKVVCERCPVFLPCLIAAVDGGEQLGVWGGFTVKHRRTIARDLRRWGVLS